MTKLQVMVVALPPRDGVSGGIYRHGRSARPSGGGCESLSVACSFSSTSVTLLCIAADHAAVR